MGFRYVIDVDVGARVDARVDAGADARAGGRTGGRTGGGGEVVAGVGSRVLSGSLLFVCVGGRGPLGLGGEGGAR